MPIDASIPLKAKVPTLQDALTPLSTLLDMQGKQIANDSNQALLGEKTALRNLVNDPSVRNPDGSLNQRAFTAKAQVLAPTIGNAVAQGNLGNQSTQIANTAAQYSLSKDQTATAMQILGGLGGDKGVFDGTPDGTQRILAARDAALKAGIPQQMADGFFTNLLTMPPQQRQQYLKTVQQSMISPAGQITTQTPNVSLVNDGAQLTPFNTNPNAPGGAGAMPGIPPITNQLPPTQPTVDDHGTPGVIGPHGSTPPGVQPPASGPSMQISAQEQQGRDTERLRLLRQELETETDPGNRAALQREIVRTQMNLPQQTTQAASSGFVPTGMKPGAALGIQGTQAAINDDWTKTTQTASGAAQNIGILQNIKQHAAGAATGVAADRQAVVAGLASMLGIDAGTLEKTDTDLLVKNSSMLALAGGNSDAARALAQMANPNVHMSKDAIISAANQIIAQQQMAQAKQRYLAQFKPLADAGHPEAYNAALTQFNAISDPRVIQFSGMTPQEKSEMKSAMSPQERDAFGKMLGKARQLGIAQ